jgi:hypothetical protein
MYKVKQICVVFLTLVVLVSMMGCASDDPFQYQFRQDRDQIEKVEICALYQYEKIIEPLVSLTEDKIDAILSDLSSLECWEVNPLDSPRDYGSIIICIRYLDGEIEIIGTSNNGWITPEGDWDLAMTVFEFPDLREVLFKYVDVETLAAISPSFQ